MLLDEECKGCLYKSQMKKVEQGCQNAELLQKFRDGVKVLCDNPPKDYCAPLLMRDIDRLHRKIFGCGIDYSKEKSMFNRLLLRYESELFERAMDSRDPLAFAVRYAMASNYIDFARLSDLDAGAADYVLAAAERAEPDKTAFSSFRTKLAKAKSFAVLHDNCGEIVLDKVMMRVVRALYPDIRIYGVVRGSEIINDVTLRDAEEIRLTDVAEVFDNGSDVPGTYLKEVNKRTLALLSECDVIVAKGLGNLETLYGEGYNIFYSFCCKCAHIASRFNLGLWSAGFAEE